MRKQRETLPNLQNRRATSTRRQAAISESQLSLLQLQDRRSALADIEQQVRATLQNLDHSAGQPEGGEFESAVRETLQTEKNYLDALIADYNTHSSNLWDLYIAEGQLIKETEAYATYIDERVLWIASASTLSASDATHAGHALWRIAGPDAFREIIRAGRRREAESAGLSVGNSGFRSVDVFAPADAKQDRGDRRRGIGGNLL